MFIDEKILLLKNYLNLQFSDYMLVFKSVIKKNIFIISVIIFLLVVLHFTARYNYLFFHILVELFSIIVAFSMFALTWNARKIIDNPYLIFVGVASVFIGALDLLHTLTYHGMNIFNSGTYYANQFWIATRLFESIVLLLGFLFISKKIKISYEYLFTIYFIATSLITLSILYWKIFPDCYIDGLGQTHFKIYSEYTIILVLITALFLLVKKKRFFHKEIYIFILLSIISTILSEFSFTLYFSNTGFVNELGHFFKVFSFYFIYKAIIETGFIKPGEILYRNLKISQEKAENYNRQLENEIATRDKLFSIIAHDLRSPFSVLLIVSEMLYKDPEQFDKIQLKRQHEILYKTSISTFDLLENLLQWSRIKSGIKPFFEKFDLKKLIEDKIRFFKEASALKNIRLLYNENETCEIYADKQMIDTVLRNLISNALKFTYPGGGITISTKKSDNHIYVSVSDTGTGMKKEELEKIFNLETNLTKPGTDNEKGSGLGLQLVKEFIEKNKGTLNIESESGRGSTFTFVLKCKE